MRDDRRRAVARCRRWGMGVIVCLAAATAGAIAQSEGVNMEPMLEVTPEQVLVGDPVAICASGLGPGAIAAIRVAGKDVFGNTWSAEARYRADEHGTIDAARDASLGGSYAGVDPAGLFWSLACDYSGSIATPFAPLPDLTVTLIIEGEEVASRTLRRVAAMGVVKETLSGPVTGVFIRPEDLAAPSPALIVLGGSEGGYNEGWATIIASKTRLPTLALAYFGADGLPPTLENIPLETVERAIAWLGKQEGVAPDRIGIVGASRGGELALLAASLFPEVKAVVGYTPSGIIWEGIGDGDAPAWTYRGEAFPYLRVLVTEDQQKLFEEAVTQGTPYFDAPSFAHSLEAQRSRIEEATIPVERSQAAFLLIGNPGDGVWPSHALSQVVIDRLTTHGHPRPFQLLSYEEGGHMLVPYPYYPTTMRQFYLPTVGVWEGLGSSAKGAARAAEDSWPRVLEFLRNEL